MHTETSGPYKHSKLSERPDYCYSVAGEQKEVKAVNYCQWFARCTRVATRTRKHPVLGDVPICRTCDENMAKLDAQVQARR